MLDLLRTLNIACFYDLLGLMQSRVINPFYNPALNSKGYAD
ncbi:hypothetical protein GPSY_3882 [Paraglaciecola psychrophila 170]|nr:hypothetical protein GPSY_3882 [Paraglaciecola psychrophila 170]